MKNIRPQNVFALLLLLLFLSSWGALPLSLAMPKPVTCGMECCADAGVCACEHQHDAQAGNVTIARWQAPCSERCASLPSTAQKLPAFARVEKHSAAQLLTQRVLLPGFSTAINQSSALKLIRIPRAPPAQPSLS